MVARPARPRGRKTRVRGAVGQRHPCCLTQGATVAHSQRDPDDDELVTALANRLQSPEIKVHLLFAGDPPVPGESAAIVPWGKADLPAISALLAALEPLKPIVIRLPGGDEAAKRRFFREGIYSERADALPTDRKSGRDLLLRLEILAST